MEDNNIVNVADSETVEEVTDLHKEPVETDDAVVVSDANQVENEDRAVAESGSDVPDKGTASVKVVKERLKKDAAQIAKKKKNEELIKKLLAENKELEKTVKVNRDRARKRYGMLIYESTYSILGLTENEKECLTNDDFAKLESDIKDKLTGFVKLDLELVATKSENEELKHELFEVKNDDTVKKLTVEIEALKADNEKLANERDEALKVNQNYNDVDLTQFDCFVPTVFTIAKKIGLREELEKCKTVEEYRAVVGKILGWFTVAVEKMYEANSAEEN